MPDETPGCPAGPLPPSLQLGFGAVGDAGAVALAALCLAPALHTLTLGLEGNDVSPTGAAALAELRRAPADPLLRGRLGAPAGGGGCVGRQWGGPSADAPALGPDGQRCRGRRGTGAGGAAGGGGAADADAAPEGQPHRKCWGGSQGCVESIGTTLVGGEAEEVRIRCKRRKRPQLSSQTSQ